MQNHCRHVALFILFIYLFTLSDASKLKVKNDSYNKLGKTEIEALSDNSKGICKELKLRHSSDSNNIKSNCEFNCT